MSAPSTVPPKPLTAGEEVLVFLLKSNGPVKDLIDFRIAPDQAPANWPEPLLVYEQQSDKRQRLLNGDYTGLVHTRFTIVCKDKRRWMSRVLAQAVREALKVNNSGTIAGVLVKQVFVPDGERDESLPAADGSDSPERYRTLDCVVHYVSP